MVSKGAMAEWRGLAAQEEQNREEEFPCMVHDDCLPVLIEAEDESEACRLAEEMVDRGDEPDGECVPSAPEFSEAEEL